MQQRPTEPRESDGISRSEIRQLVSLADQALVTGDDTTCRAIVETIYDLLDRHTGCATPVKAGREEE